MAFKDTRVSIPIPLLYPGAKALFPAEPPRKEALGHQPPLVQLRTTTGVGRQAQKTEDQALDQAPYFVFLRVQHLLFLEVFFEVCVPVR